MMQYQGLSGLVLESYVQNEKNVTESVWKSEESKIYQQKGRDRSIYKSSHKGTTSALHGSKSASSRLGPTNLRIVAALEATAS